MIICNCANVNSEQIKTNCDNKLSLIENVNLIQQKLNAGLKCGICLSYLQDIILIELNHSKTRSKQR